MNSSMYPSALPVSHRSVARSLLSGLCLCAFAASLCMATMVRADATLTYELTGPDAGKTVKRFSMARFFIRIDDPADSERYLLYQAGKFFPLFSVDTSAGTYTRLTPPVTPYMSPESRTHHGADKRIAQRGKQAPVLRPTRKERTVAGIHCRVVHELQDGQPVIEHCMANSARLGVTDRDLINLARVFAMSREQGFDWLGAGSKDETFAAVQSRDLRDNRMLQLTTVSRRPPPAGYLRIPRDYREVSADTPDDETAEASTVEHDDDSRDEPGNTQASGADEPAGDDDAVTGPAGEADDETPDATETEPALSAAPGAATADKSPAPQTGTAAAP